MGNYNPHQPYILGQEWVPIREELTDFSPTVNAVEEGTEFVVANNITPVDGQFYNNYFPLNQDPFNVQNQVMMIAVYPYGKEAHSGPIQRVVIPCNAGNVTGADIITSSALVARNVFSPDDANTVEAQGVTATTNHIGMSFAINQYAQILNGKRILGVNLLYSLGYDPQTSGRTAPGWIWGLKLPYDVLTLAKTYGLTDFWQDAVFSTLLGDQKISRVRLGEINPLHGVNVSSGVTLTPHPWTLTELQRFERSNATPFQIVLAQSSGSSLEVIDLYYAALEIIYCEETRIIVGNNFARPTAALGINSMTMRAIATGNTGTVLPAGRYTCTVTSPDTGDAGFTSFDPQSVKSTENKLNALRQLYSLPDLRGVKVTHPFPVDDSIVGQVFTREETNVLTQVTLHDSGSPISEMQVYGRQAVAQVYGNITAIQKINDTPVGGSASYPFVRYYARRFGDTQIPLKLFSTNATVSGTGNFVVLTPNEFDALEPENGIIDGWKEVTLQFPTAPVMGTGFLPDWRWSASGEDSGNRWEVLGALASAVSGGPGGNYLVVPPTRQQPYIGTYGDTTEYESWVPGWNPPVSSTTADTAADAVLMFSQYSPPITGLGVTMLAQPVSGIGDDSCGIDNCCIPTHVLYNKVAWSVPLPIICDQYSRVTSNGWGTYLGGIRWALTGVAADWSTNGSQGLFSDSTGVEQFMVLQNLGTSMVDYDVTVKITINNALQDAPVGILGRYQSGQDYVLHAVGINQDSNFTTTNPVSSTYIRSRVASVNTVLTSSSLPFRIVTGDTIYLRAQGRGKQFRTKVWKYGEEEPANWNVDVGSSTASSTGSVGIYVFENGTYNFDNFLAVPLSLLDSTYELQRNDTADTTWQTIMRATNLCTNSFNDYEARVGLPSSYRIRSLNAYEFEGQWSSTVSATISSPGVSGGPCINGSNVLIFTSNYDQTGASTLAYIEAYEGRPEQEFNFIEASNLKLQQMYRRNFQVAFKGTERGGESFTRAVLVNAAAVSPPRLADMVNLRDLAWDQLPYVAVRDDIGDRWLAAVVVPSNKIWKRKIYLANIGVVEVTDTPYPVDP